MSKVTTENKYEKNLSITLALAAKKFGIPSISFLEMEIIEFNEARYHKFIDATFQDLTVDVEEVQNDLLLLVEYLSNELLTEHCQEWTTSSRKLGLIWNIKIDFNVDQIDVTTREKVIRDVPKPEFNFTISE